jgi:hypothetical protein
MGVQTLVDGRKYRIFVEGLGTAGRRKQYTEVFYGKEAEARQRHAELVTIRNSRPEARTMRWPKIALPPSVHATLVWLAKETSQSPEQFLIDIIAAMADDLA